MLTPVIFIALAYVAGLLLGHGFLYFPYTIIMITIVFALIAGLLTMLQKFTLSRCLLTTIPILIGMTAYVYSAAWLPADHYTRMIRPDSTKHEIIGTIDSSLDRDPERTGFVLKVQRIDDKRASGKLRVSVREQTTSIGYNDTISFSAKLLEPRGFNNPSGFDYAAYLAQSGIYYTTSIKSERDIRIPTHGSGIIRTIYDWRERIRQAFLASTHGDGSAILQAMTLGEEGGLTDELRDKFMAAGVTHIISISGSHLGMVGILCFGLIRQLLFLLPERHYHRLTLYADPRKIAGWLTLLLVTFYTLLAGGQVATVRSLIMIAAAMFALILDRDSNLMHALSLAGLCILAASPQAIFDISFQLSFLSVLVIAAVVAVWSELGVRQETRLRKLVADAGLMIVVSLAASLATGPLVAHYFNQASFAGLLSNMIVVPFAGIVVVPLGLLSGILSLFLRYLPFAEFNQVAADFFIAIVSFFAKLPFSQIHTPSPDLFWLAAAAVFLSSLFIIIRAKLVARFKPFEASIRAPKAAAYSLGISGAALIISVGLFMAPAHQTSIMFPDVGQGDCALIELASGERILIDGGGTRDNRFDIGRRVVAPLLWNKGIRRLDLVILTHPHPDHMNGLLYLLKSFPIREVWTHAFDRETEGYEEFMKIVTSENIRHRVVSADDKPRMLGSAELRVLHPEAAFRAALKKTFDAENNRSLVVRIAESGHVLLFTGDIGASAERYLIDCGRDLKCDLLKVPHHGSRSSSTDAFVLAAHPGFAVFTVGRGNPYHHPSGEVLERYRKNRAQILRTDEDGEVIVHAAKEGLTAERRIDQRLSRINLTTPGTWGTTETVNARRLLLRAAAL